MVGPVVWHLPPDGTRFHHDTDHLVHSRISFRTYFGVLLAGLAACGRDPHASTDTSSGNHGSFDVAEHATYSVVPVANPGQVTGSIQLDGDVPADTMVHATSDTDVCGSAFTDTTLVRSGDGLGGVIVWLDGVTSGKGLPWIKRHDIANDGCRLTPRVQAVVAGGTLNVRSLDRVVHRNRFVRDGEPDSMAVLITENDEGQVVPLENVLATPGLVEVRCDQHPWTRGWIAVFNHPYFAVTAPDGSFAMDSVPPGRYRLMAWHERTGTTTREVVVEGGGKAEVKVSMQVRNGVAAPR